MISAQAAISRFRRDLTIGAVLRALMLTAALTCILAIPMQGGLFGGGLLLIPIYFMWMRYLSVQGSRMTADSPLLIATGRFDEAETRIDAALRSFSLFKPAKLVSLHHLALLRHAQRRWQESAMLCRALLRQRMGSLRGLTKPSLLLLVDDLLHLGDMPGAGEAMGQLQRQRLNLAETLTFEQLQLEYLSRLNAFGPMLTQTRMKVRLAELMPAPLAARTQAFLALAAKRTGRSDLCDWLKRRAELLADPDALMAERPVLAELWR